MITIRQLIEANMNALNEGTLGAFLKRGCQYDYGHGCRCSIGVALSEDQIKQVHRSGVNGLPLGALLTNVGLEVENKEVFGMVQQMHDAWASGTTVHLRPSEAIPGEIHWLDFGLKGVVITERHYRSFIAMLDRLYPAVDRVEVVHMQFA